MRSHHTNTNTDNVIFRLHNHTPDEIARLTTYTHIFVCSRASIEQIKALPPVIDHLFLGNCSAEQIAAIPPFIKSFQLTDSTTEQAIALISARPATIFRLSNSDTVQQIRAMKGAQVRICSDLKAEQIDQIKTTIERANISFSKSLNKTELLLLQHKLDIDSDQVKKLKNKIEHLQDELKRADNQNHKLESKNKNADTHIIALTNQYENLMIQLEEITTLNSRLQNQILNLENELNKTENEKESIEESVIKFVKEKKELLRTLREQLNAAESEKLLLKDEINSLQARLKSTLEFEKKLNEISIQESEHSKQLQTTLSLKDDTLKRKESEINTFIETVCNQKDKIDLLSQQIDKLNHQKEVLTDQLETERKNSTTRKRQLDEELKKVKTVLAQERNEKKDLQKEIETQSAMSVTQQRKITEQALEIARLNDLLQKAQDNENHKRQRTQEITQQPNIPLTLNPQTSEGTVIQGLSSTTQFFHKVARVDIGQLRKELESQSSSDDRLVIDEDSGNSDIEHQPINQPAASISSASIRTHAAQALLPQLQIENDANTSIINLSKVIEVIKDKNTKSATDVANFLNMEFPKLLSLLKRNKTSYTEIKLKDVSDEEIIKTYKEYGSLTPTANSFGVQPAAFSEYLSLHRKDVCDNLFSRNKIKH